MDAHEHPHLTGTAPAEALEQVLGRGLLAETPSLAPLIKRIALAASHEVTVLLTGETGTGKTYLARIIHECSPRKSQRFLTVPCGALSANLIDSELFGHVKGAFTGAGETKKGRFAAAGQGTILLDEIDTLGLEQQTKLLRVVETGEYEPVGSNETFLCHARLIVASNWNLEEAVEIGKFRQDLYYRLNVFSFNLPALRERLCDIAPLARGMMTRFNKKFNKELTQINPETTALLARYPWPGNIRQLENVVQHAVLLSSGPVLLPVHLPTPVRDYVGCASQTGPASADSLRQYREGNERVVIQQVLEKCNYSRARAAKALGISRVTLYKKMKKYNLMGVSV